ncbi:MAG: cupin domain-containing protein, partial [Steroidobacteraceae bacterium]|nr:cupin domain-containing protein [Steroidobacteraceae bacterium]MDW8260864.1 cupin domain-containing protein [Gammaproteobacteria bacterium]
MSAETNVRRIVTGHDPQGRAIVLSDDTLPPVEFGGGLAHFTLLWSTGAWPADNNVLEDGARRTVGLTSPGGSVLRIVDFAPNSRSPMHRTHSLDYGIVLAGELDLELDSGERRHLRTGDVVVQRGTNHAWICGPHPARMAFVL